MPDALSFKKELRGWEMEHFIVLARGEVGGGGKQQGLGPRNDVLTTCKAIR